MAILPQTFFTFVGGHFMSLSLFSAWHFLCFEYPDLFFYVGFNLVDKCLGRFKSRYKMFRNNDSSVF